MAVYDIMINGVAFKADEKSALMREKLADTLATDNMLAKTPVNAALFVGEKVNANNPDDGLKAFVAAFTAKYSEDSVMEVFSRPDGKKAEDNKPFATLTVKAFVARLNVIISRKDYEIIRPEGTKAEKKAETSQEFSLDM